MYKNTIITLMHERSELTRRLISGLVEHERDNIDKIVIVDNGSKTEEAKKFLEYVRWSSSFESEILNIGENVGFTLGANYGLQRIDCEPTVDNLVFLISNDVQINGPFINQAKDFLLGTKRCLVGNRHIYWDSGWNTFDGVTFDYLEGYFLAMTSYGWREISYFDSNYAPYDYEDIDLSTKAKKNGYKIVSLNNPNIVHQGGGTIGYNPERERITKRNREYFKNKWTK